MNDTSLPASRAGTDDEPGGLRPALPVEWLWRVKGATRDLVRRCGLDRRAGEICGYGKSTVHRWGSTDHVDVIPLPAALLLEAECGVPLVTMAMAELHGRALGPKGSDDGPSFRAAHIGLAKESAELAQAIADAEEDGVITPNEQKRIDAEAADVARATAKVRDAIAAGGGAAISVLPARGR